MARSTTEALERVHLVVHQRLYRAPLGYTGNAAVAEDALAEAFAQALAHTEAIRDVQASVCRAAFRIAAGEIQRSSRELHGEHDRAQLPTFTEPLDHLLEALQARSTLGGAR